MESQPQMKAVMLDKPEEIVVSETISKTNVNESEIRSHVSPTSSSSTGSRNPYYFNDKNILFVNFKVSKTFIETLKTRELDNSESNEFEDHNGKTCTTIVVRDSLRLNLIQQCCKSLTIRDMPLLKIQGNLNVWKKLLKTSQQADYTSIYFDDYEFGEQQLKGSFDAKTFDRLISILLHPDQRLLLPFSPTILKYVFQSSELQQLEIIPVFDSDVYTKRLKASHNILSRLSNDKDCQAILSHYDFDTPRSKTGHNKLSFINKFDVNEKEVIKEVHKFLDPIEAIESVRFIEIQKNYDEESAEHSSEDATDDKINSPVISYLSTSPSINIQLKEHLHVVQSCLDKSFPDPICLDRNYNSRSSFSMMYALSSGFSIVMYSMTHLYPKDQFTIHNCMALRLILQVGMCLIWSGSLVHSGAKSRTNDKGEHLIDMRLFAYLWSQSQHGLRSGSQREDSFDLHRKKLRYAPL
mmetsp:Transcript_21631/g.26481  ORF Transcript_21631/g.26481 Transcript_21631/m.26481 type:complete len:467 (-) Transcript_21631:45-1445(-)